MLDGRLIRVQLRDWNPAYRPSWRPGLNKELNSQTLGSSDDISVDPKPPKPSIVNIATHMADLQLTDSPTQSAPPPAGEACDLNEVQDETGNPPPEASSSDDPECSSIKEILGMEKLDIKQGEPALPDTMPYLPRLICGNPSLADVSSTCHAILPGMDPELSATISVPNAFCWSTLPWLFLPSARSSAPSAERRVRWQWDSLEHPNSHWFSQRGISSM